MDFTPGISFVLPKTMTPDGPQGRPVQRGETEAQTGEEAVLHLAP